MTTGQPPRSLLELATRKIAVIAFCAFWTFPAFLIASTEVERPLYAGVGFTDDEAIERLMVTEPEPIESGPPLYSVYKIQKGESVSQIAQRYKLNVDTIISVNRITSTRFIPFGTLLKIPNQNGILYTIKAGDSPSAIAAKLEVDPQGVLDANGLAAGEEIAAGRVLFVPGAMMDGFQLREINGDLFRWPLRGYITSYFGWREDPFGGSRQRHNGLDIAAPSGTAVKAAMEGRVLTCSYSPMNGNYIILEHHSGYRSFYGHLSAFKVSPGQYVNLGQLIGLVGNTGISTGPHVHFTVYKYGVLKNPVFLLP